MRVYTQEWSTKIVVQEILRIAYSGNRKCHKDKVCYRMFCIVFMISTGAMISSPVIAGWGDLI